MSSEQNSAELRGSVLRALTLNDVVPSTVDARVDDGWVTLTGSVTWQNERDEAEHVARSVPGVVGVDDQIELQSQLVADDVGNAIKKALERNVELDAEALSVDAHDGSVVVTGKVRSWAEHDDAIAAAWAVPGITNVEDHIVVED